MVLNVGNLKRSARRNQRSLYSAVKDRTLEKLDIQGLWTIMSNYQQKLPFRAEMNQKRVEKISFQQIGSFSADVIGERKQYTMSNRVG